MAFAILRVDLYKIVAKPHSAIRTKDLYKLSHLHVRTKQFVPCGPCANSNDQILEVIFCNIDFSEIFNKHETCELIKTVSL